MLDTLITTIQNGLLSIFHLEELVVVFIAMLPIVEARLAIPMAIDFGISPILSLVYGFIGSAAVVPILLAVLMPFINFLRKTKFFKKIGDVIYEKFEKKSHALSDTSAIETGTLTEEQQQASIKLQKKREWKKMLGVFIFVAIPMPLTGVWTGSAIAAITKLSYPKALVSILAGNLVASGIITLLCVFFEKYIDIIILIIGIAAIVVVIALIIKIIFSKPKKSEEK